MIQTAGNGNRLSNARSSGYERRSVLHTHIFYSPYIIIRRRVPDMREGLKASGIADGGARSFG
jgi:hypothetical protein